MAATNRWRANLLRGMCGRCGNNPPVVGKAKCQECLDYASEAQERRKDRLRHMGLCTACGNNSAEAGKDLCSSCLDYHRRRPGKADQLKASRARLKDEVMRRYGGDGPVPACQCCGETEPFFLVIDHIASDASWRKNRGLDGTEGSMGFYRWLRTHGYPEGFQVLCHNCNAGKRMSGGIDCPHKLAV